jgi:disulfide bond formation protein DsbB
VQFALADAQPAEVMFTLLVAVGLVATIGVLVLAGDVVKAEFAAMALPLAAIVAVGAMAGSLYFSEVRGFVPCELCWFQRIAMYPLAFALPVAAWRRDHAVVPYAIGAAVIGAGISIYHYQLQLFPDQGSTCAADTPCSARWIEVLGFVSIPLLALGSFVLITVLLTVVRRTASSVDSNEKGTS